MWKFNIEEGIWNYDSSPAILYIFAILRYGKIKISFVIFILTL